MFCQQSGNSPNFSQLQKFLLAATFGIEETKNTPKHAETQAQSTQHPRGYCFLPLLQMSTNKQHSLRCQDGLIHLLSYIGGQVGDEPHLLGIKNDVLFLWSINEKLNSCVSRSYYSPTPVEHPNQTFSTWYKQSKTLAW